MPFFFIDPYIPLIYLCIKCLFILICYISYKQYRLDDVENIIKGKNIKKHMKTRGNRGKHEKTGEN